MLGTIPVPRVQPAARFWTWPISPQSASGIQDCPPLGSASRKCLSTRTSAGIETHNEPQPNWKKSCQIRQKYSQENRSTSLISNHHDMGKMEDETRVLYGYRYAAEQTDDGLSGEEGTFNMCTLWLVEALTRAGRANPTRLQEACLIFEKLLGWRII